MKKAKKALSLLLAVVMAASLLASSGLALNLPAANTAASGDDASLMSITPTGTLVTGATVTGDGTTVQIQGTGGTLRLNDDAPAGSIAYVYGKFASSNSTPAIYVGSGWTVFIGNTESVTTVISAVTNTVGKVYGVQINGDAKGALATTVTIESGSITADSYNTTNPSVNDVAYGVYAANRATVNIGAAPVTKPGTDYTSGPQISTDGTSGNSGITALTGSTANIYQGYVSSQSVNATAVYINGSTVNVQSGDKLGTGRTQPVFLAEVNNLTSDVAMAVTGSSAWSITGVGAKFSGYTAFSADSPSNASGGGLGGGTFRGDYRAISFSFGAVQDELRQNYYLRNDISGDFFSFSNGTRGVSASGYSVSGTVTAVNGEDELVNATSISSAITGYTMPCNMLLTYGSLLVNGTRSLDMNGKNLEYDAGSCVVEIPRLQSLTITDNTRWTYTNADGKTPGGIVRRSDTGCAVNVENGGTLTLGVQGAFGPMITAVAVSTDDSSASVTGLVSMGIVNMYSGSIYGTYAGAEMDKGGTLLTNRFTVSAGSAKNEYSVISGKTHYGLTQYGGTLNIAGGIFTLDSSSASVQKSSDYPWALYMNYGSNRDTTISGITDITGGYFYSVATDATVNGRNQQLADLMASNLSFVDNQGTDLSSGAITKPTNYLVAAPYVMHGTDNVASKDDYDNYQYYGYAIYNGLAGAGSYEYNTNTGLHVVTVRDFSSYFTVGSNGDYKNTSAGTQKVCTCCGQTYTGASCPNCTNTRCSVCGKCPNHCTCKNTDLVTSDHFAYISGYPNGTFHPTGTLTRAEAAQIFYSLLQNKNYTSSKYFIDVNHNDWYYTQVSCLASKGIISGYPDGYFHANWKVTRAEFCAMAAKFYSIKSGTIHYTDVPSTYWGYKYIVSAVSYGWINDGYGRYYPDQAITRQEVVLFVNNMTGRIPDEYFISSNYGSLKSFSDVTRSNPNYYAIMEAANGHTYIQKSGVETWKKLSD